MIKSFKEVTKNKDKEVSKEKSDSYDKWAWIRKMRKRYAKQPGNLSLRGSKR